MKMAGEETAEENRKGGGEWSVGQAEEALVTGTEEREGGARRRQEESEGGEKRE